FDNPPESTKKLLIVLPSFHRDPVVAFPKSPVVPAVTNQKSFLFQLFVKIYFAIKQNVIGTCRVVPDSHPGKFSHDMTPLFCNQLSCDRRKQIVCKRRRPRRLRRDRYGPRLSGLLHPFKQPGIRANSVAASYTRYGKHLCKCPKQE